MNELFDKESNAQKESLKKSSKVHLSSRKHTRKCAMKTKERKKQLAPKIFIRHMQKTGVMDIKRFQVNDS